MKRRILRDAMMYQQAAVCLHPFLEQSRRTRMDYGTVLFRYAFIREPHGAEPPFLMARICC